MTIEEFAAFEALVNAQDRTEVACTRYLHHAKRFLVPADFHAARVNLEGINIYGRSDFCIIVSVMTGRRESENYAYFFEAKAPQLYVMEFDATKNRCIPTYDLMQAENQLIHYVSESSGNRDWLIQNEIADGRNVKPGGIIIGRRSDRYLKTNAPSPDADRLATRALKLREDYFYATTRMQVITWDRILDFVNPQQSDLSSAAI